MNATETPCLRSEEVDTKLVYVVDDEAMVGDVVQIILRREGYRPRYFQDPKLALRAILQDSPKPALLLTDFRMGPMDGLELINRCKQSQPELKTILYSGNIAEDALPDSDTGPDAFLRKPFPPKSLLSLVHDVLEDGPN
jgi:DNA-binding NtrC family response regulator